LDMPAYDKHVFEFAKLKIANPVFELIREI
jgi:hypothetical protein